MGNNKKASYKDKAEYWHKAYSDLANNYNLLLEKYKTLAKKHQDAILGICINCEKEEFTSIKDWHEEEAGLLMCSECFEKQLRQEECVSGPLDLHVDIINAVVNGLKK